MRYIFNTTFLVEAPLEQEWLTHLQTTYLPYLQVQKWCSDILFTRIKHETRQDGISFSLQLIFDSKETLQQYLQNEQERFLQSLHDHFGQRILPFSTLLEEVEWKN